MDKDKCILLSEISQSEKAIDCMIPMGHSGKGKTMEIAKIMSGFQGLEGGRDEWNTGDF